MGSQRYALTMLMMKTFGAIVWLHLCSTTAASADEARRPCARVNMSSEVRATAMMLR